MTYTASLNGVGRGISRLTWTAARRLPPKPQIPYSTLREYIRWNMEKAIPQASPFHCWRLRSSAHSGGGWAMLAEAEYLPFSTHIPRGEWLARHHQ
jgi:hypothetical protein